MAAISNRTLARELLVRGLVPEECRLLDVVIGASGAVVLRFETYLTADQMLLFADAFASTAKAVMEPPIRDLADDEEGDR